MISDFWKKKPADLRIKTSSPTAVIHVFKKYILQKESFFVLLFSVSSLSVAPLLEFISGIRACFMSPPFFWMFHRHRSAVSTCYSSDANSFFKVFWNELLFGFFGNNLVVPCSVVFFFFYIFNYVKYCCFFVVGGSVAGVH